MSFSTKFKPGTVFIHSYKACVMKKVSERKTKAEVISFDISGLPEKELHDLFRDLPIKSLKQWLNYYIGKEQYEVCKIIKQYLDVKSR
jgi:hypothetical protein